MNAVAVAGRVAGAPRVAAAVRELAWIEGIRLVRHPIFLAGAALSVVFALTYAPQADVGGRYFVLMGPAALPLALAALVVSNLAALRSRRGDTGELYRSLAAPAHVRTVAHLLAAGCGALACAALVGAGFAAYGAWEGLVVTPLGDRAVPSLFELAQGPVAVLALGALGVALARWLPFLPVAGVAAVALLVVEIPFALWNLQSGYVWLAPLVNTARVGADSSWPCAPDQAWPCFLDRFATDSAAWHLVYLAGLALALAAAALLKHGLHRRTLLVGAAAGVLVVAGAVLQLP